MHYRIFAGLCCLTFFIAFGCKKAEPSGTNLETHNYTFTDSVYMIYSYYPDSLGQFHESFWDTSFGLAARQEPLWIATSDTPGYVIFRQDTFRPVAGRANTFGLISPQHSKGLYVEVRLPADSIFVTGILNQQRTVKWSYVLRGLR